MLEPIEASSSNHSPFEFSDGRIAREVSELIEEIEKYPSIGGYHLVAGHVRPWLLYIGRNDLAEMAEGAERGVGSESERVERFLEATKLIEYFRQARERRFTFLIAGRTGVGKSSTINSLLGQYIAPVGDCEPVTAEVVAYETYVHGVPCRVVDTPGLCDNKGMDESYVEQMRAGVGQHGADCFWFVTTLAETRVRTDETDALMMITNAFGPDIWRRAVLVFTFADYFRNAEKHDERLRKRIEKIRSAIRETIEKVTPGRIGHEWIDNIPGVSVTNEDEFTPGGARWLGELYLSTLSRLSDSGFAPFLLATMNRLEVQDPRDPTGLFVPVGPLPNGDDAGVNVPMVAPTPPAKRELRDQARAAEYSTSERAATPGSSQADPGREGDNPSASPWYLGSRPGSAGSSVSPRPTGASQRSSTAPTESMTPRAGRVLPRDAPTAPMHTAPHRGGLTSSPDVVDLTAANVVVNLTAKDDSLARLTEPASFVPPLAESLRWSPAAESKVKIVQVDNSLNIDQSVHLHQNFVDQSIRVERREVLEREIGDRVKSATGVQAGLEKVAKSIGGFVDGVIEVAGAVSRGVKAVGRLARRIFGGF